MALFMLAIFVGALAVPGFADTRAELLDELRDMRKTVDPTPETDDLFSVVNEIENKNSGVKAASPLRKELIDELRSARQQIEPEATGSALRLEIIDELRNARQQTEPKKEPRSALRDDIIAELREARRQSEPKKEAPSALRQTIIQELREARQKMQLEELINEPAQVEQVATPPVATVEPVEEELPWTDDEQLLNEPQAPVPVVVAPQLAAASALAEQVLAFNRLLRTLVLSGTALGLASVAKLPELDLKKQGSSPAHLVTLVLFFAPLLATTGDYLFDLAIGNEFALIACCWGLAAMACMHERVKQP